MDNKVILYSGRAPHVPSNLPPRQGYTLQRLSGELLKSHTSKFSQYEFKSWEISTLGVGKTLVLKAKTGMVNDSGTMAEIVRHDWLIFIGPGGGVSAYKDTSKGSHLVYGLREVLKTYTWPLKENKKK